MLQNGDNAVFFCWWDVKLILIKGFENLDWKVLI